MANYFMEQGNVSSKFVVRYLLQLNEKKKKVHRIA